MSTDRFTAAMGYIDEDLISDAVTYMPKKSTVRWTKWVAVAACFCLVVGVLSGTHLHMKQYVLSNHIPIYYAIEYNDSLSASDVKSEQADRLAVANNIHNTLSEQNYEWYGGCYYDFENDKILVGLTEASDSNKDIVLTHTGDTVIEFYQCEYSYQYLKALYNKLDSKRTVLSVLGVDRFNISIEKNRVNVHIDTAEKYEAIYVANEMDSIGGAIVFTADIVVSDSN